MNKLDDMILLNLIEYYELIDLYNFKNTCNSFNKLFLDKFNLDFKKEINSVKKNYISIIHSLFGGIKKMALLPTLKWKYKYEGSTGYIDRINPEDLQYTIMRGIDSCNRPFISIKIIDKFRSKVMNVETIFQRYSNSKLSWTHGTNGISFINESGYIISGGKLEHVDIKANLKNIIKINDK